MIAALWTVQSCLSFSCFSCSCRRE